ncbi:MAG: carboxymuconolactone decarboxylase family protein, partial [Planctomycetota bacterium]
ERERRLARLFTVVVLGDWEKLRRERHAAPAGEPDRGWRECVLQAHIFAGFPRVVEAYGVLASCGGLGQIEPEELLAESDQPERGRALFERIYEKEAVRVREMLRAGHPDFERWIEGHAYGRILSRPGLEPRTRELLAVAGLAALGQDRQMASHARGALRCGARPEEVGEVIESVADLIDPGRLERARTVCAHFGGGA